MTTTEQLKADIITELHALIDCFPVGETRHIVKAARYVQAGKMDDTIATSGAASVTELADLALMLSKIR